MAGSKKFTTQANQMADFVGQLFNRAIRSALLEGLEAAVRATKHDSSNAAAHWMLAGEGKSRPWQRRMGKVRDLRGTRSGRAPTPPVGYRRDEGANLPATVRFVRERELKEVLEDLVAGRRPEFRFYFYNAVGGEDEYAGNAAIEDAGAEAVKRTIAAASRRIIAGNTRQRAL